VLNMVADPRTRMYISQITPVYLPSQTFNLIHQSSHVTDPRDQAARRNGHAVVSRYIPIGHHRMSTLRIRLFDVLLFDRRRFNSVLAKHAARYGEMLSFLLSLPPVALRRLVLPRIPENNLRAAFLQHLLRDFHVRRLSRDQAWTVEYGRTLEPLEVDKDPSLVITFQEDSLITRYLRVLQDVRNERLKAQELARAEYERKRAATTASAIATGEAVTAARDRPSLPASVAHAHAQARARVRASQHVQNHRRLAQTLRVTGTSSEVDGGVHGEPRVTAEAGSAKQGQSSAASPPSLATGATPSGARKPLSDQVITGTRLTARARQPGSDQIAGSSKDPQLPQSRLKRGSSSNASQRAPGAPAAGGSKPAVRGGGFHGSVVTGAARRRVVEFGDSQGASPGSGGVVVPTGDTTAPVGSPMGGAGSGWGAAEEEGRHEDMLRVVGLTPPLSPRSPFGSRSGSPRNTQFTNAQETHPGAEGPVAVVAAKADSKSGVTSPSQQESSVSADGTTAAHDKVPESTPEAIASNETATAQDGTNPTLMERDGSNGTASHARPLEPADVKGNTAARADAKPSAGKSSSKRKHSGPTKRSLDSIKGTSVTETSLLLLFTAVLERRIMINLLTEKCELGTEDLCAARRQAESVMSRLDPHDVHKFFAVPYCESTQQCLQLLLQVCARRAKGAVLLCSLSLCDSP